MCSLIEPGMYGYHDNKEDGDGEYRAIDVTRKISSTPRTPSALRNKAIRWCGTLMLLSFTSSYIALAIHAWSSWNQCICLMGNEAIYDDVSVKYNSFRFQRAGFHDSRHKVATVYEGRPNQENEAAWEKLLDAGVITISNEENTRLLNGSASTRQDAGTHIVELEVFHQLHCLKWLRDQFWETDTAADGVKPVIDLPQKQNHTDHCIDYLRQTIMCHVDVTPITFEWNDGTNGYIAHHSTEQVCRDFSLIHEWARDRDNSGLHAGGAHVNVELEQPELYD